MATFSIGEAVRSGFRVIRDHPAAVLIWGLSYFALAYLPQIGMAAVLWRDIAALSALAPDASEAEMLRAAGRLQAWMSIFQLVQLVGALLAAALLSAAVFRAVMEPQNDARWFLRLGNQELWVGVVLSVAYVLLVLAVLAALMPPLIYGVVVETVGTMGAADWAAVVLLGLALIAVVCWAGVRVSLGLPMSFAERSFRLFESWPLTRGHGWRIFLALLSTWALAWLIQVAFFLIIAAALIAAAVPMLHGDLTAQGIEAAMRSLVQFPPANWPLLLAAAVTVVGLLTSILVAATWTITLAPLASIYRQLTAEAGPQ